MKTQERREGRQLLCREFGELLRLRPEDGVYWQGTVADLVEAAHVAYECGTLADEQGHPLSFTALVGRACLSLHVAVPRNPRRTAYQARNRKGTRRLPLLDRYCRLVAEGGESRPLRRHVRFT